MNCPKCEEGVINKITFKKSNRSAFICDNCESLWFEDEKIGLSSHALSSFSQDEDLGYSFDDANEKDQDHQPIRNIKSNSL